MSSMKQHGKRARQEGAIERTEASILVYEKNLKSSKDDDEKKLLKKKIERAQTTIKNTKII
jgi:rubrerythrin